MAAGKTYAGYRFVTIDKIGPSAAAGHRHNGSSAFELDESDIYDQPEPIRRASRKTTPAAGKGKRVESEGRVVAPAAVASSLPVNVPDWSKILRGEYRGNSRRRDSLDDDSDCGGEDEVDDGGDGMRVPPHELVARTRVASFSVHEGRGRTLKGRDLSRVRNAIWEKTGFED